MRVKINGGRIEARECRSIWEKTRGLMFRKDSEPIVLIFKNPTRRAIHSFFCKPFLAVWVREGRVIERRIVNPFSLSVKPREKFTHLFEIPLENNKKVLRFTDDYRKV